MLIRIAISPGELIDKITILQIKTEQITDPAQLTSINKELAQLTQARDAVIASSDELGRLTAELKQVNQSLWQIEDEIRDCERRQTFDDRFVKLARAVYLNNDRRAELKRAINSLLGSDFQEEKSYQPY